MSIISEFILFIISLLLYIFAPEGMDKWYISIQLTLGAIASLIFFKKFRDLNKRIGWISITILFIIGYSIVHFQLPLLYIFGYDIDNRFFWFIWANEKIVNEAVSISILGIISFYLGRLSINYKKKYYLNNSKSAKFSNLYYNNTAIRFILIFTYLSYILFFLTSGSYKIGAYSAGDQLGISNYAYVAFNSFLMAGIILKLFYISGLELSGLNLKKYLSYFGKPLLLISFWHIIFSFFVGDRGPIIVYGLLLFSLFFIRVKKINLLYLLFFIFSASVLFTFVKAVRVREVNSSYLERVTNSFNAERKTKFADLNVPGSETVELAYSIRCLNHAVANVPSKYNYTYGYFQILYLTAPIPFLSGIYFKYFGNGDEKYNGTSNFISYLIQGNNPRYGDGTTTVADLYLDFGTVGVIIGLFLFGLFFARFELQLFNGTPETLFIWVALLVYFSMSIYLGRSSILMQFQKIGFIYIIIILNNLVSFKKVII